MTRCGNDGRLPTLLPWPARLPDRFTEALGYEHTVQGLESSSMRMRLLEVLRQQGIDGGLHPLTGPRRFILIYRESAGDELAWSDGVHGGAGQLDHRAWLAYLRGDPVISSWLVEHEADLGSSGTAATHALALDRQRNQGWLAPMTTARTIVRAQQLEVPID
jgi:hypothetical protein